MIEIKVVKSLQKQYPYLDFRIFGRGALGCKLQHQSDGSISICEGTSSQFDTSDVFFQLEDDTVTITGLRNMSPSSCECCSIARKKKPRPSP